jgi:hypothetical protein
MTMLLLLLAAGAAFLDGFRRPSSQWIEADRNRGFWLGMIVVLNVLGVAAYLLFVLPRFPRGAVDIDRTLLKSSISESDRRE